MLCRNMQPADASLQECLTLRLLLLHLLWEGRHMALTRVIPSRVVRPVVPVSLHPPLRPEHAGGCVSCYSGLSLVLHTADRNAARPHRPLPPGR